MAIVRKSAWGGSECACAFCPLIGTDLLECHCAFFAFYTGMVRSVITSARSSAGLEYLATNQAVGGSNPSGRATQGVLPIATVHHQMNPAKLYAIRAFINVYSSFLLLRQLFDQSFFNKY